MGLFEITAEEIYQAAIEEPLERKIEKAQMLIREYEPMALELSPDGYYLAFSGGKDSIVTEMLMQMAGVKFKPYYNNTTIDPPELVQFIKKFYPEVKWNNPQKNLPLAMADSDNCCAPTRLARWCCEQYKEHGGDGLFKVIGVRAEESARRKGLWQSIRASTKKDGSFFLCPILYWTECDVWNFIRQKKWPIVPFMMKDSPA